MPDNGQSEFHCPSKSQHQVEDNREKVQNFVPIDEVWSQARSFWTAVPQAPVAVYVPDKRVQGMENGKEEPSEDNPTDIVKIEACE